MTAANPDPALCARPRVRLVLDPSGLRIDGEVVGDLGMRARDGDFLRSVVRTDSPERYGISIGDYTG